MRGRKPFEGEMGGMLKGTSRDRNVPNFIYLLLFKI